MFSLSETENGKFTFRCHGWGWESELTATDQVVAAEEAIACNEAHKCTLEMRSLSDAEAPQGELGRTPCRVDLELSMPLGDFANDAPP